MGNYLTKKGLTKYTTKLKDYISKAKVAKATDADTVTGHTVNIDVPANAKFTDTDTWRPQPDWNATSGDAAIKNKPTSMPASDVPSWAKASTKPTYSKSEVGLGKVDNTADADKSVKHAATAGSANSVAWSNVSGKPALGNAASKTTRGLNATAASGWKDATTDGAYVPDMTFIAYWNGAYSNTASNLAYCNKGAFGTAATANKGDFAVANHTHSYNSLTNKPTIPSVGNGTVTITQNGATKGSFTMNQGGNTTIALTDTITSGRVTAGAKVGSTIGQYATAEGSNTTASGNVSHAEGNYSSALGQYSHAEGSSGTASGEASHSEGNATEATGWCSHAEGNYTLASGQISHASGCGTNATRFCSYSEGLTGKATGVGSHVEGTYAVGYMGQGNCYIEFNTTIKEIPTSQLSTVRNITGLKDVKYYIYCTNKSSAPTYLLDAIQDSIDNGGNVIHLFDNPLSVDEFYQFTPSQIKQATISSVINKPAIYFGNSGVIDESILKSLLNKNLERIWIDASFNRTYTYSLASGTAAHCEGGGNTASGHYSHAEGVCTTASGTRSHAQGNSTTASGTTAFASGCSTTASGQNSYAGGDSSTASGSVSFAIGSSTTASADSSFATGYFTTASGQRSFSEGYRTIAEKNDSHASGSFTKASNENSYAMGHFNAAMAMGGSSINKTGTALSIGNGTSENARSNAFSVQFSGITKAANTITASTTADYAEFFEWLDENPNAEDRVGYFVTLDGDKIKIAEADDDYILGVISGAPFILGNGDCDVWNGMYLRDEFRRLKEEPAPKMIRVKNKETKKYENQIVEGEYEGTRFILNPNYDNSQKYKSRFDRPEWAAVGMLGVLPVRHDGTAKVNGYVTVGANGIATACERTAENAYRVIKENSDSVVEIIFR